MWRNKLYQIFFAAFLILAAMNLNAQEKLNISGVIKSSSDGKPLELVNISVKGTTFGTTSSADGRFELQLPSAEYILLFQCVGYQSMAYSISPEMSNLTDIHIQLKPKIYEDNEVVVTGTRSERFYQDVPVLTEVIAEEEIRSLGVTDLRDVLLEVTGLNIDQNHGQGVQLQGFDPEYTLILVDGSPIIGRVAGTLDLTRFSVANIERIEIVKGPNSSLYGSEALAGVVNIITRTPQSNLAVSLDGRYGNLGTNASSLLVEMQRNNFGISAAYNMKGRNHFDLDENTVSWSGPEYTDHTFNTNLSCKANDRLTLKLNSRLFIEDQTALFGVSRDSATVAVDDNTDLTDWSLAPLVESQLSGKMKLTVKGYVSRYRSDNLLTFQEDGQLFDDENFDQQYRQAEAQLDIVLSPKNWIKLGSGYIGESVEADRIEGDKQSNSTRFAFAQYEWLPLEQFNAVAGARFDSHSDYGEAFSPKFALLYKMSKNYRFRAGVGSGFKAPNFSQLYLNFTNTLVGYSVFGATSAIERLNELASLGQIQETLIAPGTIQPIGAENSIACNFSIDASPLSFLNAKVNFFRNDVQDLIDVQAIAKKTNNQSVFTYFNLNRVYTTGIESELSFRFDSGLKFELGYQYIQAKDKDVIEQLENGEIFKVGSSGRIRAVQPGEYGGLFRRPRNSGTVKLSYRRANGFAANIRTVLRGKSGLFDLNGNAILDDQSEYSAPYALVNMNVNLPIADNLTLGTGIENMFDYVDVQSFAGAPGRLIYGSIRYSWSQ